MQVYYALFHNILLRDLGRSILVAHCIPPVSCAELLMCADNLSAVPTIHEKPSNYGAVQWIFGGLIRVQLYEILMSEHRTGAHKVLTAIIILMGPIWHGHIATGKIICAES